MEYTIKELGASSVFLKPNFLLEIDHIKDEISRLVFSI